MRGGMTDAELIERLREWFRLKGDVALRQAADRLEELSRQAENKSP
jgi:hypothetical protein